MKYRPERDLVQLASVKSLRDMEDNLKRDGATKLAARIDAFWHSRGYRNVRHWAEPHAGRDNWIWVVRGNLVNGCPPRLDELKEAA